MAQFTADDLGAAADAVSVENAALERALKSGYTALEASSLDDGQIIGAMKAGGLMMVAQLTRKLLEAKEGRG